MRKYIVITLCTIICACIDIHSQVDAASKYLFNLSPKTEVGNRYRFVANGKEHRVFVKSINDSEQSHEDTTIEVAVTAIVQVLAVDSKGQEIKMAYTIEEFYQMVDKKHKEIIAKGQILTTEYRNGQQVLTLDGQPLAENEEKLVSILIINHEPGSLTNDDLWGMKEPMAIGQSWPIDIGVGRKFLADLKDSDINSISGSSKLVGLKNYKGKKCYNLIGDLKVSNNDPNKSIFGSIVYQGLYPADIKDAEAIYDTMKLTLSAYLCEQKDGTETKLKVQEEKFVECDYEPL